ncbi:MAG: hypothetical protein K0S26_3194, partial [Bacteroidota bacterium]|nr:hypothetical protein [Bacteroidota bacterium]
MINVGQNKKAIPGYENGFLY